MLQTRLLGRSRIPRAHLHLVAPAPFVAQLHRRRAVRPPAARGEPGTAPGTPPAPAGRDARRPRRARRHRPRTAESPSAVPGASTQPRTSTRRTRGSRAPRGSGIPAQQPRPLPRGPPRTYLSTFPLHSALRSLPPPLYPELPTRPGAEPAVAFSQLSGRDPPPPGGPSECPAPDLWGCP